MIDYTQKPGATGTGNIDNVYAMALSDLVSGDPPSHRSPRLPRSTANQRCSGSVPRLHPQQAKQRARQDAADGAAEDGYRDLGQGLVYDLLE